MHPFRYIQRYSLPAVLLAALVTGCIDPFNPKVADAEKDFLVVDGFINTNGVSTIKLSHAVSLNSSAAPAAEKQARMFVEDDRGTQYPFTEGAAGTYTAPARTYNPARKHRLHFFTRTGQEYASDFTEVKVTPPIDSLTWRTDARGLTVRVNTHDEHNNSRYYRWTYDETWMFTTSVFSLLEWRNHRLVDRQIDIYNCWATSDGATLRLSNSTRLGQDRIADFPLVTLPPNSIKLGIRYSILVRQYAQTQEEYQYWDLIQKNTENLGSIFDPLPSQVTGNVHRLSDNGATVLGYVGAYSVTEKRLFVDRLQLPRDWVMPNPYDRCIVPDTVKPENFEHYFSTNLHVPLRWYGPVILAMDAECVDCRLHGTNVRPLYWQ